MWVFGRITYVMSDTILIAIEYVIGTACDVDGIDEAIFAEGIGKVPEGFFVAGGNEIELVTDAANGATFYLSMKIEAAGNGAVADEDELSEEGTASFLNEVLDFLASGYSYDAIVAHHSHITKS